MSAYDPKRTRYSYLLDTRSRNVACNIAPFSGCYPAIGRTCAQCASKTGSVAAAITCCVAPPNIICLNRLWVKAPLIKRLQANV